MMRLLNTLVRLALIGLTAMAIARVAFLLGRFLSSPARLAPQ